MLQQVQKWVEENRPDQINILKECLNAAATESSLAELEGNVKCRLPEEFRQACLLADGMHQRAQFSPWKLMSIQEITKCHDAMCGLPIFDEFVTEYPWSSCWIPFATDMTGDWSCLKLTPESEPVADDDQPYCFQNGNVFVYRHTENLVLSMADSLQGWSQCWIEDIVEFAM